MTLTLCEIGERWAVAPQSIKEVQTVEDADALVGGAEGVDVGIVGIELTSFPPLHQLSGWAMGILAFERR
jgi:hypothetical protein